MQDCLIWINQAKEAGLDGFLVSGNPRRIYFERMLENYRNWVAAAALADFKIGLEFECYFASPEDVIEGFQLVYDTFAHHPNIYKEDGKPALWFWLRNSEARPPLDDYRTGSGTYPLQAWEKIVTACRTYAGGDVFLYACMYDRVRKGRTDGYSDYEANTLMPLWDGLWEFGGLHSLVFAYNKGLEAVIEAMRNYRFGARQAGKPYVAGLTPGFWRAEAGWFADPVGTSWYRANWEEILRLRPDGVMIQSWNDYSEDAQIAPSVRAGRCLLEQTRYYADRLHRRPPLRYDKPRVWISHPSETARGDEVYVELLSLPNSEGGFTVRGQWQNQAGSALEEIEKNFNGNEMEAMIFRLPLAVYRDAAALRLKLEMQAGKRKDGITTRWQFLNPINRYDKFTSRYLWDEQAAGSGATLKREGNCFYARVPDDTAGPPILCRRTMVCDVEQPTGVQRLTRLWNKHPPGGTAATREVGLSVRYFAPSHPDWDGALEINPGTCLRADSVSSDTKELERGEGRITWNAPRREYRGLGSGVAINGFDAVYQLAGEALLKLQFGSMEISRTLQDFSVKGGLSFRLGKEGFLQLALTPVTLQDAPSHTQHMIAGKAAAVLNPLHEGPADMFWLESFTADGRQEQSNIVFSGDKPDRQVPTRLWDSRRNRPVTADLAESQALLGSWAFHQDGPLYRDESLYRNTLRAGGSYATFGWFGGAGQSPSWHADEEGGFLSFDGNDFLALPQSIIPKNSFSVSFAVWPEHMKSPQVLLNLGHQFRIELLPAGEITVRYGDAFLQSREPLQFEQWHNVHVAFDLEYLRLSLNGRPSVESEWRRNPVRLWGPATFGVGGINRKTHRPEYNGYHGKLDNLVIRAVPVLPAN
ncbi:MAG: hypothetical protein JW951_06975 [Lentisphaerae bacterium]|nr:hypothetical protein [Lentisphaerota bacterium]